MDNLGNGAEALVADLVTRLDNPAGADLALARDLEAYRVAHGLNKTTLAQNLRVPKKRTYISEIIHLLELPEVQLATLEGRTLPRRLIQKLVAEDRPKPRVDSAVDSVDSGVDSVDSGVDRPKTSVDTVKQADPRGTPGVETPKQPFKHGPRTEGGGGSKDKTLGELIVSVLVGLVFVPAYVFCWLVHQRGFDDLCEIEELAYARAVKSGPWNVIRRVVIGFVLLFIFILCLPRLWQGIEKGIHWMWHPKTPTSQTPPAPTQPPANPPAPVPAPNAPSQPAPPPPAAKPPVPKTTLAAPVEVHVDVRSPDIIVISWRAVGPSVTYNVYSSATSALTNLRKENEKPLHKNVVTWTPETGLDVYWITVTTVEGERESAYSEAIQVIRHPQPPTNDSNGLGSKLLDKAGNALQKYIP